MPTHYEGPSDVVRALSAYVNLIRASESILLRLSAQCESYGVTLGQFGILEALLHRGPMCQAELGEKLLRSPGNVTVVLDNLERRGLVRRARQKQDRRKILVHLTAAGLRLISRYFPGHAKAIQREMGRLSKTEQEQLRRLCRKLGRGKAEPSSSMRGKDNDNDRDSSQ
jgi:MarR family transcriptional regulator, 2-MHQ and catechol-resistance regulon repressor